MPFVGVHSTENLKHLFGLVYEHVNNLDLRQHLRNEPSADKLEPAPLLFPSSPQSL